MTADRIDHPANLRGKSQKRARTSPRRAVDRGKCQVAFGLLLSLACLLAEARPTAAASLAVDVDDATPGIQSMISVVPSAQWTVVIRIEGVAANDALAGFELDVDYDGSVLQIVDLEAGDFLPSPMLVLESDIALPDANLTQIALSGGSADGDGVLARITFEALAEGTSELRLGDVRLARADGGALIPSSATQGKAFVVPEPALGLSLSIGALASAGLTRRRRRIARSRRTSATHVVFGCALLWAGGALAQEQRLDVNLDGWIDVLDVVAVQECLGNDPALDESCARADVDGDGDIDTNDRDEVVAASARSSAPRSPAPLRSSTATETVIPAPCRKRRIQSSHVWTFCSTPPPPSSTVERAWPVCAISCSPSPTCSSAFSSR